MYKISHSIIPVHHSENLHTPQNESDSEKSARLKKISFLARLCEVREPENDLNRPERLDWILK